jgi:DNA-binding CsgD family transcriptional regulator
LLTENERQVDQVNILRLGRSEDEGFQCADISPEQVEIHKKRFIVCRELYEINKRVKW